MQISNAHQLPRALDANKHLHERAKRPTYTSQQTKTRQWYFASSMCTLAPPTSKHPSTTLNPLEQNYNHRPDDKPSLTKQNTLQTPTDTYNPTHRHNHIHTPQTIHHHAHPSTPDVGASAKHFQRRCVTKPSLTILYTEEICKTRAG
ncbi:hypothetical protein K432DRAFT_178995 [Lepidopterella palustris CBS 459.81]|uniref:Uncharacterized protein n=1 Tax=Lepidopterella palustris CBS 459.81 TaxID=1314670 RepID=A0A8E2E0Y1_9PEZI|nr:hypothetical protein K432DRAFT_178995 [Lepidopterella palustris CBS 459.81]